MAEDFGFFSSDNGTTGSAEEDPAAAFLAQQESEIAGIENDEGFSILDSGEVPSALPPHPDDVADEFKDEINAVNGEVYQESNGPSDSYAAIARADRLSQEPESIRKWREEQITRLENLDAASRKAELEWKEKARKELDEWYIRQNEQLEKMKKHNRAAEEAFVQDCEEDTPGTEWERVARLCDFNPKTSKQSKDVSRMRSVLISLKQSPLVR
ncbi:clathrin light chain B-like [Leucoraja erinacea]|uniref:clathrin light chain B-like n=1 Tax=Leucoraja erinaceus TaxID=7782 RepID=UPI0024563A46|nr:clathrin light chain B-like [Leucoraja erinacea]